jgi:hypothetical protein
VSSLGKVGEPSLFFLRASCQLPVASGSTDHWPLTTNKERQVIVLVNTSNFVDAVAREMACGVETAVECWMAQIDEAMTDLHLTSLGRLNAVRQILANYKSLTGKEQLQRRKNRSDSSSMVNQAVASTGN